MVTRIIRLRYAGACKGRGSALPASTQAWWDVDARTMECLDCVPEDGDDDDRALPSSGAEMTPVQELPTPRHAGQGGASARRAVVLVAIMLAACTASSNSTSTPPATRALTRSASTSLRQFVALAKRGLRQDYEASYSVGYGPAASGPHHYSFSFDIWYRASRTAGGDVAYERTEGVETLRFFETRGLFQCLRSEGGGWHCIGPFQINGNGEAFRSIGYELPVFLAQGVTAAGWCGAGCALSFSDRRVDGRQLSCAHSVQGLWCLASDGLLAYGQWGHVQLRLTSSRNVDLPAAFVPPVTPRPSKPGHPPVCELGVCTPPPFPV